MSKDIDIDIQLGRCMNALFNHLMTTESFDTLIVESKNEIICISEADYYASYSDDLLVREAAKLKMDAYRTQQFNPEKAPFIVFKLDNVRYKFKQSAGYLSVSAYKKPSFSKIDKKYKEKPLSSNVELHAPLINELAEQFHYTDFLKLNTETEANEFCIGRFGLKTYFTTAMLNLCYQFKHIFSEPQLNALEAFEKDSFDHSKKQNKSLVKMFTVWEKFLRKHKHGASNKYRFNDHDNWAFIEETDTHILIEQASQNTVFAYVKNKATNVIKVWYSATINNDDVESYEELLDDSKDYVEMMRRIQTHYGFYVYPFDITADGYFKSTRYYLEHPDDTSDFLVFDSSKGYNLKSALCYCLETDIDILQETYNRD